MLKRFNEFILNESTKPLNEGYEIEFDANELVYQIDGKIYSLSVKFIGDTFYQPAEQDVGIPYGYSYVDGIEASEIIYAEKFKDPSREADFKELSKLGLDVDFYSFITKDDMIPVSEAEDIELSKRFVHLFNTDSPGESLISIVDNNKIISMAADSAAEDYDNNPPDGPDYEPDDYEPDDYEPDYD